MNRAINNVPFLKCISLAENNAALCALTEIKNEFADIDHSNLLTGLTFYNQDMEELFVSWNDPEFSLHHDLLCEGKITALLTRRVSRKGLPNDADVMLWHYNYIQSIKKSLSGILSVADYLAIESVLDVRGASNLVQSDTDMRLRNSMRVEEWRASVLLPSVFVGTESALDAMPKALLRKQSDGFRTRVANLVGDQNKGAW